MELGQKLGVSFQQLQKYEGGFNRLSAGRLFEIAQLLKVRIDYFFKGLPETISGNDAQAPAGMSDPVVDDDVAAFVSLFAGIKDRRIRKRIMQLLAAVAASGNQSPDISDVSR